MTETLVWMGSVIFAHVLKDAQGNTKTEYFGTDNLGSTVFVTDSFGNIRSQNDTNPFGIPTGSSGFDDLTVRYTGKDLDEDTGLYYYNARWYDPETGRFITEDPIKDGDLWYGYVGNNPMTVTDPSGLYAEYKAGVGRVDVDEVDMSDLQNPDDPGISEAQRQEAQRKRDAAIAQLSKAPPLKLAINNKGAVFTFDFVDTGDATWNDILSGPANFANTILGALNGVLDLAVAAGDAANWVWDNLGGRGLTGLSLDQATLVIANATPSNIDNAFVAIQKTALTYLKAQKILGNEAVAAKLAQINAAGKEVTVADDAAAASSEVKILSEGCFVAGTLVATADGLRPIEEINVGDLVWAYDENTKDIALKTVARTFVHEVNQTITLTVGDETVETTSVHPFWIVGKGWTTAGDIRVGDRVLLKSGVELIVQAATIENLGRVINVFNLEVEGWHTYFVGDQKILVHNKSDIYVPFTRNGAFRQAKRDLGIPMSQDPFKIEDTLMTNQFGQKLLGADGLPINTREYIFIRSDGSKVVIQEHSVDPLFGEKPHFNVRPIEDRRHGTVPGTQSHYYFNK